MRLENPLNQNSPHYRVHADLLYATDYVTNRYIRNADGCCYVLCLASSCNAGSNKTINNQTGIFSNTRTDVVVILGTKLTKVTGLVLLLHGALRNERV